MEQALRDHLLTCAGAFVATGRLQLSTLSKRAAGDWRYFQRLADGGNFTARKYDEVMAWFSTHWPEEAEWPAGVPRPDTPTLAPETADENDNQAADILAPEECGA